MPQLAQILPSWPAPRPVRICVGTATNSTTVSSRATGAGSAADMCKDQHRRCETSPRPRRAPRPWPPRVVRRSRRTAQPLPLTWCNRDAKARGFGSLTLQTCTPRLSRLQVERGCDSVLGSNECHPRRWHSRRWPLRAPSAPPRQWVHVHGRKERSRTVNLCSSGTCG
jgi:hypothetical protein